MFTGIIQGTGEVVECGSRLFVRGVLLYEVPVGGSVAVNGCCLTHVGPPPQPSPFKGEGEQMVAFDLSEETFSRTTLGSLKPGARVNLEAAVRAGDPMGGHFVQGHVDGVGEFLGSEGEEFRFRVPEGGAVFLADKGSIAIDGVSLTVVRPSGPEFSVALVPHTLASTTLGDLRPGDKVNLEYDVLARYVARLWRSTTPR